MWSQPELRGLPARANTFNAADLVQPKAAAPVIPNPFLPAVASLKIGDTISIRAPVRFTEQPRRPVSAGDPDADYATWLKKREREMQRA